MIAILLQWIQLKIIKISGEIIMKTLLRRLFALLMCLILILSARVNAELDQPGFSGSNINSQDYTRTASPVTSYLVPLSSGYMAVKAEKRLNGKSGLL